MATHNNNNEEEDDDLKDLNDVVRSLPRHPIKHLLSNTVCEICILRLFGLHQRIYSRPSISLSMLKAMLYEFVKDEDEGGNSCELSSVSEEGITVCCVCLGILQFVYSVDNGEPVRKDCASDFAAVIRDVVEKEGYQIDGFCFELSVPQIVAENEQALCSYVKKKYSNEPWFKEKVPTFCIASKDFLKLAVTNPLEKLLNVQSKENAFRIRLTYTASDASARSQPTKENNGGYKRRKTDENGVIKKNGDDQKAEGNDHAEISSSECGDDGVGLLKFDLPKVSKCCSVVIQCHRTSVYVGGRYLKFSRNVSQSRWIIDDERMGEASVEELIGGNILPICQGDSYKFHAAGREDIDVRMLGTGRPFLVEVLNARQIPSDVSVKDMEVKINSLESKLVGVKNLKVLGSEAWDLMREGEAEKQKQYVALVWISRPLSNDDLLALSSPNDMQVLQKTPVRVLHRRSPIEREKIIHWMRVEKISGSSQYFLLHLCTQAGTYIKEFVHGDLGRTQPSIGSILNCRAEIVQLDVTDVKMDCFTS